MLLVLASSSFLFQKNTIDITELIIFIVFLFLAFKKIRMVPEFVIVVSPIIARGWSVILFRLLQFRFFKNPGHIINYCMIAFIIIITYLSVLNNKIYSFGPGLKEKVFPQKAVNFLIENNVQENMFNSNGGYLMWKFYPKQKVFIDGRNEVYDESFIRITCAPIMNRLFGTDWLANMVLTG